MFSLEIEDGIFDDVICSGIVEGMAHDQDVEEFEENKEALINTFEYYEEYHHTSYESTINSIKSSTYPDDIDCYWQTLYMWI